MESTTNEIIVRTRDFKLLPDVEHYIQHLKDDGVLEKLARQNKLTAEELKKLPLGRMCDIFEENVGRNMESGDIVIFSDTGEFEVYTGGI